MPKYFCLIKLLRKRTCHFFGDPSQLPALRAGSFLEAQAISDVSLPLSMLVNNSKRDHMLFTVSSSVFNSHGGDGQTVLDLKNTCWSAHLPLQKFFCLTSGMRSWTSVQVCDNLPQNHPAVDGLVDWLSLSYIWFLVDWLIIPQSIGWRLVFQKSTCKMSPWLLASLSTCKSSSLWKIKAYIKSQSRCLHLV